MSAISIRSSGNTDNLERFLKEVKANSMFDALESYAQMGVDALMQATPTRSGASAASWFYEIRQNKGGITISWINTNKDSRGVPIVILLQYGHMTGNGGYVQGLDFINPATKLVFDDIEDAVWKAVQSA